MRALGGGDAGLARRARATQEPREGVDYAAARVSREEAQKIADLAERFVAAIGDLLERSE